eukprot:scaffold1829_cov194-Ochromonas_danica.AAC.7
MATSSSTRSLEERLATFFPDSVLIQLVAGDPSLTALRVPNKNLGAAGAMALSEVLQTNTAVTDLDMAGNRIGDKGAAALANALSTNSTLSQLILNGNEIGFKGVEALMEALRVNDSLRRLELINNMIDGEATRALSKGLKTNHCLVDLDNCVGAAPEALSEALTLNTSLTSLNLRNNLIDAEGALRLSEALKVNASLLLLNLNSNKFGDEGGSALAEALKVNRTLMVLRSSSYSRCVDDKLHLEGTKVAATIRLQYITLPLMCAMDRVAHNKLGFLGARALARAARMHASLVELERTSKGRTLPKIGKDKKQESSWEQRTSLL